MVDDDNVILDLFDDVVTSFVKPDDDTLNDRVMAFKAAFHHHDAKFWGKSLGKELDHHINIYSKSNGFDNRCEEIAYLSHHLQSGCS